jgi:hypothetical protein
MNTKLYVLLAAGVLALAACKNETPTAQAEAARLPTPPPLPATRLPPPLTRPAPPPPKASTPLPPPPAKPLPRRAPPLPKPPARPLPPLLKRPTPLLTQLPKRRPRPKKPRSNPGFQVVREDPLRRVFFFVAPAVAVPDC